MPGGRVNVPDDMAVGGPVIEGTPRLGVVDGERVVEDLSPGAGAGGEMLAGLQPLIV